MRWVSAWSMVAVATVVLLGLGCASDDEPGVRSSEPARVRPDADRGPTATAPPDLVQRSDVPEAPPAPETDALTSAEPNAPAGDGDTQRSAEAVVSEPPKAAPAVSPPALPSAASPPAAAVERVPRVALVQFTTSVEDREPMDAVTFLGNDTGEILFYTDLRDLSGSTVLHRWEYEGQVVSEVPFAVGGDRWRVWSRKSLEPEQIGDWTVSVVAANGEVLAVETFSYQEAR